MVIGTRWIGQPPLVARTLFGAVHVHGVNLIFTVGEAFDWVGIVAVGGEHQPFAVGRPVRGHVVCSVVGQPYLRVPVGVHQVDFGIAVALGVKGDHQIIGNGRNL